MKLGYLPKYSLNLLTLAQATGGAIFDASTDGDESSCILTVVIVPNGEVRSMTDRIAKMLALNMDMIALGNSNYWDQITSAYYCTCLDWC